MSDDQMTLDVAAEQAATMRRFPDNSAARALRDGLRDHYLKPGETFPGGVYLTEVRAPGEGGTVRRADAVFIGYATIATRTIEVCEIKTSRADLLREIQSPAKTAAWWPYCSKFWVVAPSPDIVPAEGLPEGWGLMCPKRNGRRFVVHVEPSVRTPEIDFDLLMVLAKKMELERGRALSDQKHRLTMAHDAREAQLRRDAFDSRGKISPHVQRRLDALDELERRIGFRLSERESYGTNVSPRQFADAVRMALTAVTETDRVARNIDLALRDLQPAKRALDALVSDLTDARKTHADLAARPGPPDMEDPDE